LLANRTELCFRLTRAPWRARTEVLNGWATIRPAPRSRLRQHASLRLRPVLLTDFKLPNGPGLGRISNSRTKFEGFLARALMRIVRSSAPLLKLRSLHGVAHSFTPFFDGIDCRRHGGSGTAG
jgi:hypothetical protein